MFSRPPSLLSAELQLPVLPKLAQAASKHAAKKSHLPIRVGVEWKKGQLVSDKRQIQSICLCSRSRLCSALVLVGLTSFSPTLALTLTLTLNRLVVLFLWPYSLCCCQWCCSFLVGLCVAIEISWPKQQRPANLIAYCESQEASLGKLNSLPNSIYLFFLLTLSLAEFAFLTRLY